MYLFGIPKEIQISFIDIDTLKSFCSSCKPFWNEKEIIARNILFSYLNERNMDVHSFTSLLEEFLLSFYNFANLLIDETYFHLLDPFIKVLSNENELLPFGIENCSNGIFIKGLNKKTYFSYIRSVRKVTFCTSSIRPLEDIELEIDHRTFNNSPSWFSIKKSSDRHNRLERYEQTCFTSNILYEVRNTVLYKNSADVVLHFMREGLPIFPSPKKLYKQEKRIKYYEPFFRLVFNNKKVVCRYFVKLRLKPNNHQNYDKDILRFLYFVKYYGFVMDLAFKELQKHKNHENMVLCLEYVIQQRLRHEDSI